MTETSISLEKRAATALTQAHLINIHDHDSLQVANDFLISIKVLRQAVKNTFDPMKKKAREALNEIIDKMKFHEQPLTEAEGVVKSTIATYVREQEERRRLAQLEAEKKVREAEEAAIKQRQEEEKERRKEASEALREGDLERYNDLIDKEPEPLKVDTISTEPLPEEPTMHGVTVKEIWKFNIIDPKVIPREYLKVDEVKIGQYVRAMKQDAKIPGVQIYSEDSVAARTGGSEARI